MRTFGANETESDLVLALDWTGRVTYRRLSAFALASLPWLWRLDRGQHPLVLAVDADIGHALGSILCEELHVATGVLVVDGLNLLNFDYIDLGRPLQPSQAIPVTIKSLAF